MLAEVGLGGPLVREVRVWVVTPSFRDVQSFLILRERILSIAKGDANLQRLEFQFVFVDDTAGADVEVDQLAGLDDVHLVDPPFNLGHQRAIVYGIRMMMSRFEDDDVIVTMDSDGEDRPEDLPQLIAPHLTSAAHHPQIVLARRTKREESIKFRLLYTCFRLLFRTLTGTTVRSGNYASYQVRLARRVLQHPYFDLCYSSTLVSLGLDIESVPCPRGTRYAGRSRMNLLRLLMHGIRMLMPFTDRIAVRALAAFTAIFGLGILSAIVVVGIRVFTTAAIPGWTTFTLMSILLMSFVALGNFVVLFAVFSHSRGISLSNLEELNGKPSRGASTTSDRQL